MTGEGLLARIFQHETDHLDGTLFIDRLDDEGRRAVLAEMRRIELGLAEPREQARLAAHGRGPSRRRPRRATEPTLYPRRDDRPSAASSATTRGRCPPSRLAARGASDVAWSSRTRPRPAGRGSRLTPTAVAERATPSVCRSWRRSTVQLGAGLGGPARGPARCRRGRGLRRDPDGRTSLNLPPLGCREPPFLAAASMARRHAGTARAPGGGSDYRRERHAVMDEGLDTGPVLRAVAGAHPAAGRRRLARRDRLAVVGAVRAARRDRLPRGRRRGGRPASGEGATVAPKLTPDERWIEWSDDAEAIGRRVRALRPRRGPRHGSAATRSRCSVGESTRAAGARRIRASIVASEAGGVVRVHERRARAASTRSRRPVAAGWRPATWARGARFEPGERLG